MTQVATTFALAPGDAAALRAAVLARGGCEMPRGEIRFSCPAHDDAHPSARFNTEGAVWRCDACSAGGGAIDLAQRLGVEIEPRGKADRRIVATYDYADEAGTPLFQVVRLVPDNVNIPT